MITAAGEIIPAVTGISWQDFIRDRLLIPLGMTDTVTGIGDLPEGGNIATPHDRDQLNMTPSPSPRGPDCTGGIAL